MRTTLQSAIDHWKFEHPNHQKLDESLLIDSNNIDKVFVRTYQKAYSLPCPLSNIFLDLLSKITKYPNTPPELTKNINQYKLECWISAWESYLYHYGIYYSEKGTLCWSLLGMASAIGCRGFDMRHKGPFFAYRICVGILTFVTPHPIS